MKCKAECDTLRQDMGAVGRELALANDKIAALEREKLELIGSLTTVSKEWETKNDKIALVCVTLNPKP